MMMRLQLGSFGKAADQPAAVSNETVLHVNAAALSHRQAAQRRDDSLCAKKGMRQYGVAGVAVGERDAAQAIDGDDMLVRENHVVQEVDGFNDNRRDRCGKVPVRVAG